jgi:hypothetical protein
MNRRLFLKSVTAFGVSLLAGCGEASDEWVVVGPQTSAELAPADLQLLQEILPAETEALRLEGYDAAGNLIYAPPLMPGPWQGSSLVVPESLALPAG